jgi:tetratricopeptide (TPR) repeat protein
MAENNQHRAGIFVLIGIALLFLIGRLFGSAIFYNNWSFIPWTTLPIWWPIVWSVVAIVLVYLAIKRPEVIEALTSTPGRIWSALGIFVGLLVIFHVDSFVWAGGNLKVAQISQVLKIIPRWFEFGTIHVVGSLHAIGELAGLKGDTAGVLGWRIFSYGCAILSLLAAFRLSGLLTKDRGRRLWLFIVLTFGPQVLLAFGYIGVEAVIVPVTFWFTVWAVRSVQAGGVTNLAAMWGVILVGVVMHISAAYLIPMAFFVTLRRMRLKTSVAAIGAIVLLVGGVVYVYFRASNDFGMAHQFLFLSGKSPFPLYGVLSAQHIGDLLQVLFLTAPFFFLSIFLAGWRWRSFVRNDTAVAIGLLTLSGITVVVIVDPINSPVLDLPRLAAYLTPLAVFTGVVLADKATGFVPRARLLRLVAVGAILVPLSYLPSYLKLAEAEDWATAYFEKRPWFYRDGSLAFRDASFFIGDFDRANEWEQGMTSRSSETINMRGVQDLIMSDRYPEAINILHQIKAYDPYWLEPRDVLARLYMAMGRHQLAVPEIDTIIMINPYRREGWRDRYQYYRDTRNYAAAAQTTLRALELFPGDTDFRIDQMLSHHLAGAYAVADSLATTLIDEDATLAFPYLVKGMQADGRNNATGALSNYRRFLKLAPDEPEAAQIRARVTELTTPTPSDR